MTKRELQKRKKELLLLAGEFAVLRNLAHWEGKRDSRRVGVVLDKCTRGIHDVRFMLEALEGGE